MSVADQAVRELIYQDGHPFDTGLLVIATD